MDLFCFVAGSLTNSQFGEVGVSQANVSHELYVRRRSRGGLAGAVDSRPPVARFRRAALLVGVEVSFEHDGRRDPARDLGEGDTYVLSQAPMLQEDSRFIPGCSDGSVLRSAPFQS